MTAPDIMLLTPNGRFEVGKKICIDGLTSFHQGSWRPIWGIRTAVLGLRSFWIQGGEALAGVGALNFPAEEKRKLAKASTEWECPTCGRSNGDIIREHEEEITMAVEGGEKRENGTGQIHRDDQGQIAPVPDIISLAGSVENENAKTTLTSDSKIDTEIVATSTFADSPPIQLETEIEPAQGDTDPPILAPSPNTTLSPITCLILTPPPPQLALLRVLHYYLFLLPFSFISNIVHAHLPPPPDSTTILDAGITLFLLTFVWILGKKINRNFDRWFLNVVARLSRLTQRLFGFGLGVQTDDRMLGMSTGATGAGVGVGVGVAGRARGAAVRARGARGASAGPRPGASNHGQEQPGIRRPAGPATGKGGERQVVPETIPAAGVNGIRRSRDGEIVQVRERGPNVVPEGQREL